MEEEEEEEVARLSRVTGYQMGSLTGWKDCALQYHGDDSEDFLVEAEE